MTMLPVLYHAHHTAHAEDLPFWLELVRQYGGPVLELGCGTGRVMLSLVQSGVQVFGLDNDQDMLLFLHRSAAGAHRQPAIFQADMAAFRLQMRFPLILIPCNTLSTLEGRARLKVYELVAAHLSSGGVFVASLPNPVSLADVASLGLEEIEDEFTHPLTGDPVQVSSAWHRTRGSFNLVWHYDHLHSDGQVERYSIHTRHTLQSQQAYCREMEQAELVVLASWGDFDFSAYQPDSPALILMAGLPS